MCGIAGYIGGKQAEALLLVALERLKYRGYDSAGMAIVDEGELQVRKSAGKLRELEDLLKGRPLIGRCGIAHTRWATHGAPTTDNAHPHLSADGRVAIVHNGIIENHEELRRELTGDGVSFASQTDSEVIAHLLARDYVGDPVAALRRTVARLRGSFACAAVFADRDDLIVAVRAGSPLLVGRGRGEMLLASDLPALLPHAQASCALPDGCIAELSPDGLRLSDFDGAAIAAHWHEIEIGAEAVERGPYDSFMAKEIAEQPAVLQRILDDRIVAGVLRPPSLDLDLAHIEHVVFLACGTSWHAALLGKRFLEQLARVHVEVDISSEYRYRNPVAAGGTVVVAISQSGETADTLAGLRMARAKFIPVVSLVNVGNSTIARESDGVLPLLAGPEIGVASTKAYSAQVLALYLFAVQLAQAKGRIDRDTQHRAIEAALRLPELAAQTLADGDDALDEAVDRFAPANATVFLGRGGEHVSALEGALKLKEIAYVHATGYAAGEFKHGPIALVTAQLPVVCLCPDDAMRDKMLSNIEEVRARDGRIIAVGSAADRQLHELSDIVLPVQKPDEELLQPLLSILPLQRYAYLVARQRGCDVDQPRNLAKSVTVE